jgi:ribosomal protein S18 acetylase RimI-like enzyme
MKSTVLLRPAQEEDEPFLFKVYFSTRAEELARTNWNQEQKETFVRQQFNAQSSFYKANYPGAHYHVIELTNRMPGSSPTPPSHGEEACSPLLNPLPASSRGEEKDPLDTMAVPAGRLYVHPRANEIRIMDIALLPEFRGQGIGTFLLKQILAEGKEQQKPVTIHVENFNPAMRLYERLGFKKKASASPVYELMEWRPEGPVG